MGDQIGIVHGLPRKMNARVTILLATVAALLAVGLSVPSSTDTVVPEVEDSVELLADDQNTNAAPSPPEPEEDLADQAAHLAESMNVTHIDPEVAHLDDDQLRKAMIKYDAECADKDEHECDPVHMGIDAAMNDHLDIIGKQHDHDEHEEAKAKQQAKAKEAGKKAWEAQQVKIHWSTIHSMADDPDFGDYVDEDSPDGWTYKHEWENHEQVIHDEEEKKAAEEAAKKAAWAKAYVAAKARSAHFFDEIKDSVHGDVLLARRILAKGGCNFHDNTCPKFE